MSELMVRRCVPCGHHMWPPRLLCPACGAPESEAVPAGPGVVRERTDTRTPTGAPVSLVSVALTSGPWVIARTVDARPGQQVKLHLAADGAIETDA